MTMMKSFDYVMIQSFNRYESLQFAITAEPFAFTPDHLSILRFLQAVVARSNLQSLVI
jgi:hypothetical protein